MAFLIMLKVIVFVVSLLSIDSETTGDFQNEKQCSYSTTVFDDFEYAKFFPNTVLYIR